MTTRTLYRPVGLRELELVLDADARASPPRLPAQPIFYPVTNAAYAAQMSETPPTRPPGSRGTCEQLKVLRATGPQNPW